MNKRQIPLTIHATLNSPLNNSSSKYQYTFEKEQRFKRRIKSEGPDVYYNIQDNESKKKSYSFGVIKKTKNSQMLLNNPQPCTYNIEGDFQKMLKRKSGVKLMYGRQECKINSIFQVNDIPGPGAYNPNLKFIQQKSGMSYSIGHKIPEKVLFTCHDAPGPSSYNIKSSLLDDHKILSSDVKRTAGKIIYLQKNKIRVQKVVKEPKILLPEVNYKGDKLIKDNIGYTLPKAQRFVKQIKQNLSPGPGKYKIFSEFLEETSKQK